MTKKKTLARKALEHPELFSGGELAYFNMWLQSRKRRKDREKQEKREKLERAYNDEHE